MTTKRTPKTVIEFVIQGYYGRWEDETAEETYKEARARLKEYRENSPYPSRLIRRRVANPDYQPQAQAD